MTKQSKTQKATADKPDPALQTVAEMLHTPGVPLYVRFWLEKYGSGNEEALEMVGGMHDDSATREIARLVYDVLNTDSQVCFAEIDDKHGNNFPSEARDFIEEWMYSATVNDGMLNPWGNPEMAAVALPILLDNSAGPLIEYERDPTLAMLRAAMRALTTKRERREFLNSTTEDDAEPLKESGENRHAAFKLARVLADPRTSKEVRRELGQLLLEFSMSSGVHVDHPAIVRRAFLVMCEQRPKGRVREVRKDRAAVLARLDTVPEPGEGGGKQ
jgi:hypothetical protein